MPSIESPTVLAPTPRASPPQSTVMVTSGLIVVALALSVVEELRHWIAGDAFAGAQLLAELLIFVSALTGSVAGFAFSAFAGGGLAHLFDPVQAVKVLALCSVVIQGYSVIALRRSIEWRRLLPFLAGGAITAPFAVHWLVRLSSPMFALGLGLFLIGYGVYMLARRPRPPVNGNPWVDVAVGALGGITGGLAAFPGAFVAPWCSLRGYDKQIARGICQPYILFMQLLVLACMRSHAITLRVDTATAAYLAASLLAAHLGIAVFRSLNNKQFSMVVHCLLIVSGVSLAAKMF